MRNKTKTQIAAELKALRAARTADGWVTVLLTLIRWAALVFIARYAYLAIVALSGKNTLADIGVNFLGKVEVSVAIAWSAGVVGGVFGWRQRKLRRDTVERLQERIKTLESQIDKRRSSSRLTSRGESRPEDIV